MDGGPSNLLANPDREVHRVRSHEARDNWRSAVGRFIRVHHPPPLIGDPLALGEEPTLEVQRNFLIIDTREARRRCHNARGHVFQPEDRHIASLHEDPSVPAQLRLDERGGIGGAYLGGGSQKPA